MLDIYGPDGMLDRGKVLALFNYELGRYVQRLGATLPKSVDARKRAYDALVALLDECSEGYTHDPATSPTMVSDYIRACGPHPGLILHGTVTGRLPGNIPEPPLMVQGHYHDPAGKYDYCTTDHSFEGPAL